MVYERQSEYHHYDVAEDDHPQAVRYDARVVSHGPYGAPSRVTVQRTVPPQRPRTVETARSYSHAQVQPQPQPQPKSRAQTYAQYEDLLSEQALEYHAQQEHNQKSQWTTDELSESLAQR